MAKATLKLANGTTVTIEGTAEEVHRLIALSSPDAEPARPKTRRHSAPRTTQPAAERATAVPILEIANHARTCDEADAIETRILDRSSQIDRVLLPLYIVHEYMKGSHSLTSGEASAVTKELGVPISTANASTTLSGSAAKYVMGDRIRRHGQPVRYKLNRRGMAYIKSVLARNAKE